MPSPFPGMDPYLEHEKLWPSFHQHLVHTLYQMILPGLTDRYRARSAERPYVSEQALFTSVIKQEHHEPYLEIRQRNDSRLVTLLDVVSPANKLTAEGRRRYERQRQEAKAANANVVEIDLVLQGAPILDCKGDNLPTWDHAVLVSRWTHPDRYELYSASLAKPLPRFRVPLASNDRDTVLDLQAAVARAFEVADCAAHIDYARDPATTLSDDNRQWLHDRLRAEKLRA